MASFGDLPVGNGSMFAQQAPTPQPVVAPKRGGVAGLLGGAYDMLVKPTVTAAEHLPGDVFNAGHALGIVGGSILSGEHGAKLQASKQRALDLARKTTAGKSLGATVADVKKGSVGNDLEKIAGNTAGQALDLSAPVSGAGSFAGKTGAKALIRAGAKVGAKYGAAGGVASQAAQGGGAKELFTGALEGAGTGTVLGGAGGAVGSVLGKLAGKATSAAADVAGAGPATASGNAKAGGMFKGAATKAGTRAAQNTKFEQANLDFSGTTPTERAHLVSRDTNGDPVGFTQVSNFLRAHDMPADAQNMSNLHDFQTGVIGGNLQDATAGVAVKAGSPTDVGRSFIMANQGTLGGLKSTSGAAQSTLRQIRSATDSLGDSPTVSDVLEAASKLEGAKSHLAEAVGAGNPVAKTQAAAYQAVADHLHKALDSAGVNKAVADFKVDPELEQSIRDNAVDSGVSDKLAQRAIDTLNNAHSYGTLRSEMQHGVIGGQLADLAQRKFAAELPEAAGKGAGGGVPSWELANIPHNAGYGVAALAKLAQNSGIGDRLLGKINPRAFNAAKEAGLAPDAVTARKLQTPGGGPVGGEVPQVDEASNPMAQAPEPVPTAPQEQAPQPQTVPTEPTAGAASSSPSTPIRVRGTTPDSLLQQLGVRANVQPANGAPREVVNGISGPVQNSGGTMGATSQPAIDIPTRSAAPTSEEVPIPTRVAPEPEPTGNGQASGPVQTHIEPGTTAGFRGSHAVAYQTGHVLRDAIDAAGNAIKQAPGVARGVGEAVGSYPGKLRGAATNAVRNTNASSLIGALTGQAANQAGQGNIPQMGGGEAAPQVPSADQTADTGGDMSGMPDQGGFDPSTVPGGTLEDLEQEISNDPKNASVYKSIYDEAQKKATSSRPSATQQKNQLAVKNAQATLDQIKQSFQAAGGGQGNLGGTLATLSGHLNLNSQAATYNDTATAMAASLYKALGNTGSISDKDQVLIGKLIPKLTDSSTTANSKIAQLENLLQQGAANAQIGPDPTSSASSQINQLTGGQ